MSVTLTDVVEFLKHERWIVDDGHASACETGTPEQVAELRGMVEKYDYAIAALTREEAHEAHVFLCGQCGGVIETIGQPCSRGGEMGMIGFCVDADWPPARTDNASRLPPAAPDEEIIEWEAPDPGPLWHACLSVDDSETELGTLRVGDIVRVYRPRTFACTECGVNQTPASEVACDRCKLAKAGDPR